MKRPSFHIYFVLAFLGLSGGFVQGQTESGFPLCKEDGSPPDGETQCECEKPWIYRGEFRDVDRDFSVQLPDGVVARGGCTPGHGFRISLAHPDGGEPGGDFPWNAIWVLAAEHGPETFPKIIDAWKKRAKDDAEQNRATDLQRDQSEQTSLSSLTALHLKEFRTETDHGKLIHEAIIANNPENGILYEIVMISPATRYEKNLKLFKAMVDGFRYVPKEHIEGIDRFTRRQIDH